MTYVSFFQTLHQSRVRYLLCGGLAVNIYGIQRATADIDLILDFEKENINRFLAAIKSCGYAAALPVDLSNFISEEKRKEIISEKNLIAYSFFNSAAGMMSVDVLMDVPISFEKLWGNRISHGENDFEIQLVSISDLIDLKKYSNREQDKMDIVSLLKLKAK